MVKRTLIGLRMEGEMGRGMWDVRQKLHDRTLRRTDSMRNACGEILH